MSVKRVTEMCEIKVVLTGEVDEYEAIVSGTRLGLSLQRPELYPGFYTITVEKVDTLEED